MFSGIKLLIVLWYTIVSANVANINVLNALYTIFNESIALLLFSVIVVLKVSSIITETILIPIVIKYKRPTYFNTVTIFFFIFCLNSIEFSSISSLYAYTQKTKNNKSLINKITQFV